MMRDRARRLVGQGESLFTKRLGLHSLWQTMAENFYPMRADFTRVRGMSEEFASYMMTGRPAMAHRDLANALPAMMRPPKQWLWVRTNDDNINEDRQARAYLDWMSQRQYRAMYDSRGNFVRACKEGDGDYTAFGQTVFTVDPNKARDGLLYRCWHLKDVAWTEDYALKLRSVFHRLQMAAADLVEMFPDTVDSKVTETAEKEPDHKFNCWRIVVPVDDYDLPVRNKQRLPWVSIYIDIDNQTILEEKAVRTRGYVIPRWVTVSGSQYAYSPAVVYGLPDARMMQQVTLTMLEAAQKATDPPMIAVTEALQGGVNSGAGMISYIDADYDERTGEALRPMQQRFDGIQYGAAREERVDGLLDAVFFLNQIRMPQVTKDMTAYEASKLYEEFQRNSLPLLEPIEVEYNGGLCLETFEQMQGMGLFGDPRNMPQALQGQELRYDFETPLKAAEEQAKVFAFSAVTDTVAKAMQIDPAAALNIDIDKATRAAVMGAGGADWLRDQDQVAKIKAQQAQAAQAANAANAMAHGADTATRVATAVKSAAEAGQSLQPMAA